MDAAAAAAMSDPERNPNFRRRWADVGTCHKASCAAGSAVGTFGAALLEALKRRRAVEKGQAVASGNGDPPP